MASRGLEEAGEVGQEMTSGAGGLYPSEECGQTQCLRADHYGRASASALENSAMNLSQLTPISVTMTLNSSSLAWPI